MLARSLSRKPTIFCAFQIAIISIRGPTERLASPTTPCDDTADLHRALTHNLTSVRRHVRCVLISPIFPLRSAMGCFTPNRPIERVQASSCWSRLDIGASHRRRESTTASAELLTKATSRAASGAARRLSRSRAENALFSQRSGKLNRARHQLTNHHCARAAQSAGRATNTDIVTNGTGAHRPTFEGERRRQSSASRANG